MNSPRPVTFLSRFRYCIAWFGIPYLLLNMILDWPTNLGHAALDVLVGIPGRFWHGEAWYEVASFVQPRGQSVAFHLFNKKGRDLFIENPTLFCSVLVCYVLMAVDRL
jgi:hypothetical protein